MNIRSKAILFAILSSMLSSLGWIFQGAAVLALTPLIVASVQAALSGAIYLVHVRWKGTGIPIAQIKLHWRDFAVLTLLRGGLASVLYCYSLQYSDSIKVMFFTKLEPYFIIFWSWLLLGQRISRYHAGLLTVHIIGAILLSTGGHIKIGESQWGDLMVICAAGVLAFSYMHASRLSKELGAIHINGISALGSGILLLPFALMTSNSSHWNVLQMGWLNLVIVVLLYNVFALTLWFVALRDLEAWLVSALRAIGPVLAAPIAWLFLGQSLSLLQISGAGIVLLTSAMLAFDKSEPEQRQTI